MPDQVLTNVCLADAVKKSTQHSTDVNFVMQVTFLQTTQVSV